MQANLAIQPTLRLPKNAVGNGLWFRKHLHAIEYGSTQTKPEIKFWWRLRKVHALNKLWQPINTKISSKCALPRMKVYDCCVISLDKRQSLRQWLVHCRLYWQATYWPSPEVSSICRGLTGKKENQMLHQSIKSSYAEWMIHSRKNAKCQLHVCM